MHLLRHEPDAARVARGPSAASGAPPIRTLPADGSSTPAAIRASVDLPAPLTPDERDPLAGGDAQLDRTEHVVAGQVGVADGLQREARVGRSGGPRGLRLQRRLRHADEPREARRALLRVVDQPEQRVDRVEQAHEVERGGGRRPDASLRRSARAGSRR